MWRSIPVALAAAMLIGCGDDPAPQSASPAARPEPDTPAAKSTLPGRFHCPKSADNCATARGTIVYVEANDPDGDGDAHFVLRSKEAITLPGISVIDVEKELRPHPLPGIGDTVSAVGP